MTETLDYASPLQTPIYPRSLKVVAWVFVAFGVLAVIDLVTSLMSGNISLNFGVLWIFVGRGLLRVSPGWRTCGLVLLWLGMAASALLVVIAASGGGTVTVFGVRLRGDEARVGGVLLGLAFLGLQMWLYRVLTRPDVRRLFQMREWPPI